MEQPKKILDVKNLYTQFNTQAGIVYAVNGISFELYEGETLGIVGESGCGKSVSVLSLIRLLPQPPATVRANGVWFSDVNLLELPPNEMRHIRGKQISMIFQDPMTSLNPVLTIGLQLVEHIQEHMGLGKEDAEQRAVELLSLVGIPEARARLKNYPHQFSGGMRQRVMIAVGLACNPKLLIADEPTTALDVTIQAQIIHLVKKLRKQFRMSMIWITHDLGVVAGLADRVIVMYAGHIVEEAPVQEIYNNPRHPYTIALLNSLPRVDGIPRTKLETIQGLPPDLIRITPECPFSRRCRFVQSKCVKNPPIIEVAPFHKVACWVDVKKGELR